MSTQQSLTQSCWEKEQLFFEGDDYFRSIFHKIQSAQKSIIVESYIFELDGVGIDLLNHLSVAHQNNVKVQILVDGIGSYNSILSLQKECQKRKFKFRVYHPLPFNLIRLKTISWKSLNRWLKLLSKINKRNHRKIILIDGQVAYLGSFNISQVHSKKWLGIKAWRDIGIRIEGPEVEKLQHHCLEIWHQSHIKFILKVKTLFKRKIRLKSTSLLRINSDLRLRFSLLRDLKKRIKKANSQILITNAYFLPRQSILRALKKAAQRGVYVGICIPAVSDVWFVKAAAKSLYYRLLKSGVHIFEYQKTVLHSKSLIVDDWATVGSHNLNHRSLYHDLEIEAQVTHSENLKALESNWQEDIKNSKPITLLDLGKMSIWQRMLSRFAYWFRYWI